MQIDFLNFPTDQYNSKSFTIRGLTYSHNILYLHSGIDAMKLVILTPGIRQRDMQKTIQNFLRMLDISPRSVLRRASLGLKNHVEAHRTDADDCIDFTLDLGPDEVFMDTDVYDGFEPYRRTVTDQQELASIDKWRCSVGSGSITSAITVFKFGYFNGKDLNYQSPQLEDLSI